jgi:hypothetical protein
MGPSRAKSSRAPLLNVWEPQDAADALGGALARVERSPSLLELDIAPASGQEASGRAICDALAMKQSSQ